MKLIPVSICVAAVLFGSCGCGRAIVCESQLSLEGMLNAAVISEDNDTREIRPDAEALKQVLAKHSAGGGPSSPVNQAHFQRFRNFMIRKCNRDIGPSLTDAASGHS
jgi:hypothetical protein